MLLTFSCTFYNEFAWCEESQFTILIASLKDNGILKKNSSKPKKFLIIIFLRYLKLKMCSIILLIFYPFYNLLLFSEIIDPVTGKVIKKKGNKGRDDEFDYVCMIIAS